MCALPSGPVVVGGEKTPARMGPGLLKRPAVYRCGYLVALLEQKSGTVENLVGKRAIEETFKPAEMGQLMLGYYHCRADIAGHPRPELK